MELNDDKTMSDDVWDHIPEKHVRFFRKRKSQEMWDCDYNDKKYHHSLLKDYVHDGGKDTLGIVVTEERFNEIESARLKLEKN